MRYILLNTTYLKSDGLNFSDGKRISHIVANGHPYPLSGALSGLWRDRCTYDEEEISTLLLTGKVIFPKFS